MVICFKCDAGTKELLDRLRATGTYSDYSDIIVAAIANYAILHDELNTAPSVVIGGIGGEERPAKVRSPKPTPAGQAAPVKPHLVPGVPLLFRRELLLAAKRENGFAQLPDDVFLP